MTEGYRYEIECVVCDTVCQVETPFDDDEPLFCPMCGTETEVTYLGDSDQV